MFSIYCTEHCSKSQGKCKYIKNITLLSIGNTCFKPLYRNGWSKDGLGRQYGSSLYERLAFRDPCILEFTGLPEESVYSETELEKRLIDNLQTFLLELGRGVAFVERQVRFTFEEGHYRVDLVFFNGLFVRIRKMWW